MKEIKNKNKINAVVYISTKTGGQREISAQKRTCEKYKSDT